MGANNCRQNRGLESTKLKHFISTASDLLSSKKIEGHRDARLAAACSHPCRCLFTQSGGRDIILAKRWRHATATRTRFWSCGVSQSEKADTIRIANVMSRVDVKLSHGVAQPQATFFLRCSNFRAIIPRRDLLNPFVLNQYLTSSN